MTMTSKEFGEKIGVSEAMASRLLSGTRLPSRELFEKIVEVFEFTEAQTFAALLATRESRIVEGHQTTAFADFLKSEVLGVSETH